MGLFDKIVFGPVRSRRLGISLGINLMPVIGKVCSFDCIYCECGLVEKKVKNGKLPCREEVRAALDEKLFEMKSNNADLDVITFAGNGEPTLHPDFKQIVEDTIVLRDHYFPKAKISVLSNATMLQRPVVFEALNKVDNNILKLDSAIQSTMILIDKPQDKTFSVAELVTQLKRFEGNFILQTMFLRGEIDGIKIDNTTQKEVTAWIEVIKKVKPKQVMIYSIDREPPFKTLQKVSKEELNVIADSVRKEGINILVVG